MKTKIDWSWRSKYQNLISELAALGEEAERKNGRFRPSEERAMIQARRIYVNFDYDICDSQEYADNHWGPGNYDVYDLNRQLSPVDEESDKHHQKEACKQIGATC